MSLGGLGMAELATGLALGMVGLALFLAFARLVRGPTHATRMRWRPNSGHSATRQQRGI